MADENAARTGGALGGGGPITSQSLVIRVAGNTKSKLTGAARPPLSPIAFNVMMGNHKDVKRTPGGGKQRTSRKKHHRRRSSTDMSEVYGSARKQQQQQQQQLGERQGECDDGELRAMVRDAVERCVAEGAAAGVMSMPPFSPLSPFLSPSQRSYTRTPDGKTYQDGIKVLEDIEAEVREGLTSLQRDMQQQGAENERMRAEINDLASEREALHTALAEKDGAIRELRDAVARLQKAQEMQQQQQQREERAPPPPPPVTHPRRLAAAGPFAGHQHTEEESALQDRVYARYEKRSSGKSWGMSDLTLFGCCMG